MRKPLIVPLLLAALTAAACSASAQQAPAPNRTATLKVGDPAPDFTLVDQSRKKVTLSEFHGKQNVVLAFYVLAFTGG